MKNKETLEEFIESYVNKIDRSEDGLVEQCLKDAIKWQQERSYSEEDMKLAFCNGGQLDYYALTSTEFGTKILNKWFEQFKKK